MAGMQKGTIVVLWLMAAAAAIGAIITPEQRLLGAILYAVGLLAGLFWFSQLIHAVQKTEIIWAFFILMFGFSLIVPAIYAFMVSKEFLPGIIKMRKKRR